MDFLTSIKERAKKNKKTIVLPEAYERTTLDAADMILKEDIADLILVGNREKILEGDLSVREAERLADEYNKGHKMELEENRFLTRIFTVERLDPELPSHINTKFASRAAFVASSIFSISIIVRTALSEITYSSKTNGAI